MEKGQVAIFVIVGIVILLLAVIVLYLASESFRSTIQEQRQKIVGIPQEFELVDQFLSTCVEQTAINTINNVALQGGFYNPRDAALVPQDLGFQANTQSLISLIGSGYTVNVSQGYIPIAYWYKQGDQSPSKEDVELQMSKYFDDFFEDCLRADLERLIDQGYEFSSVDVSSRFSIDKREVVVNAEYPVDVEFKGVSFSPSRQRAELPSQIFDLFQISKGVISSVSKNSNQVPFSALSDSGFRTNVFAEQDDLIYTIADNRTVMAFAVKA